MTETQSLARLLFDRCTVDGHLDLGTWADFKAAHHVEEWMIEPVLVQTMQHVLTLAGELQREMERLAVALARRG